MSKDNINSEEDMQLEEIEVHVPSTVSFKDLDEKSKTLRLQKSTGNYVHQGNDNYIRISNGTVVHHPVAKIVKRTMHLIR